MTPRTVDKESKRRQILKAALGVFARRGLKDFKIIEVARAAGVGKGTIYEYFPSKDELIVGCFSQFLADFSRHLEAQLAGLTDPVEKLDRMVAASFEYCSADPTLMQALFDFYAAGIPRHDGQSLLVGVAPMYRRMIDQVTAIVEEGIAAESFRPVDARAVASMIMALLDGVLFQMALGVTTITPRHFAERMSSVLLAGLMKAEHD
jgi:TetR/AcrR family fatty acid metabolism transcriptional regulator